MRRLLQNLEYSFEGREWFGLPSLTKGFCTHRWVTSSENHRSLMSKCILKWRIFQGVNFSRKDCVNFFRMPANNSTSRIVYLPSLIPQFLSHSQPKSSPQPWTRLNAPLHTGLVPLHAAKFSLQVIMRWDAQISPPCQGSLIPSKGPPRKTDSSSGEQGFS